MGVLQRVILAFAPRARAAEMEAESRAWMMRCLACGHQVSVWDLGGVRYRATGNPRHRIRCRACGVRAWHRLYRTDLPGDGAR